jgi:glycosyltransferase involved in cell wall biosynthesis
MRFLLACMLYPTGPGQSYMTTELADALTKAGHEVEVLWLDWQGAPGGPAESFVTTTGVRVVRCGPRAIEGFGAVIKGASKFVLSGFAAADVARRQFDLAAFDVVIAWAPAVAVAPVLGLARKAGVRHRLLFIWDFFPDHHREIGRIPGGLPYLTARAWEQRLMAGFTAIVCTLPGNADYLQRNFPVGADQRVLVTPIWSETSPRPAVDRETVRARHGLPPDRPIAVFGGQLVEGRGFEQMLGAAERGQAEGSPLLYLFVGDGRLAPLLQARAEAQANVAWRPPLTREAYLELLGACDVGMVATVPGVTSFSIPSKTIDYLRAGLPVIAAVEHGNDFISILERYGVGAAVPFHAPAAFQQQAERLATDPQVRAAVREAAPRCLDEVFDVRHAAATVLEAVSGRTGEPAAGPPATAPVSRRPARVAGRRG